ncbi:hypothetical protein ALI22I_46220 [Saccharothrix sp. ALI-22-I]|uniref:hypothetical protein n=1 Tax=Saccharothrix sp. ALI-22-I TaxID=1933778 RepID=UPI0009CD1CB7|nr:hypothetical protein [Saccharothrix sp. ALI-22-I]ONI80660.1 hypothetical protein ALI22I_46220 [Saccharothrix sp. ALI-22-I]
MELSRPLLNEAAVFAAAADVEASMRAMHRQRLELLAQVLRCGYDLDSYQRLLRGNPAEVEQFSTDHPLPSRPEVGRSATGWWSR